MRFATLRSMFSPVVILYAIALVLVLTGILMALCKNGPEHFNGITAEKDQTLWQRFQNRLYFSAVTASSIGYGDVSPKSATARGVVIAFAVLLVSFMIGQFRNFKNMARTAAVLNK
jgi:hypothetical protein